MDNKQLTNTPIVQHIPIYVSRFTYNDFTAENIEELQKPAIDAAIVADAATEESKNQTLLCAQISQVTKQQGDAAQAQGIKAENQGVKAEQQGNTTQAQGIKAEQQGNAAETKGNTAQSQGATAESKGNTAKTNGDYAKVQGDRAAGLSVEVERNILGIEWTEKGEVNVVCGKDDTAFTSGEIREDGYVELTLNYQ